MMRYCNVALLPAFETRLGRGGESILLFVPLAVGIGIGSRGAMRVLEELTGIHLLGRSVKGT